MGRKAAFNFMPMIVIIAVLAVVGYLALRPDSSPIAKGVQWISSQIEGFTAPILDTPKCPDGFRFFNDDVGESFCCKGNVNPYTHKCEASSGKTVDFELKAGGSHGPYDAVGYHINKPGVSDDEYYNMCRNDCTKNPSCKQFSVVKKLGCIMYSSVNQGNPPDAGVKTYIKKAGNSNNLCSFKEGVKDPRKRDGSILPSCNSMITRTHTNKQDKLCPGSKPNYASIGKCCTMNSDMDGYDCSDYDNADTSRYCVLGEPKKAGERRCSDLQMSEGVKCPDGMNISWYGLGQREAKKYGASANNTWLPVCMSIDHTCIPDIVLSHVQQTRGLYTDKKAEEWKYSCSGYNKRYVERDFTVQLDNSYP